MAIIANTFQSTSAVGNREQLSDVVSRITPEDTPIYSLIPKGKVQGTHPEWEVDDLAAPAANAHLEGDEYTFAAVTPPDRVGNYTQIMLKDFIISNTQEAVENAGRVEKRKYQKLKKGIELRKDVEFAIVSNTASVAGATRKLGGLPSWLTTNVHRETGGANGGYNPATGLTVAATDGTTPVAFSKANLDAVMQSCYESGGNVRHLVVSPYVKSVFVSFMSDANVAEFRYAAGDGRKTIISNADVYEGPYGKVLVHPNRVMVTADTARNAFLIDTDMLSFDWLRPIKEDPNIAKTGDAEKCVLVAEGTLRVKNEKGLGVVADVIGTN